MELRVHGVGGPAPESVLQQSDPARSPVDGEATSAAWRSEPAARSAVRWTSRDRSTRVYHWAPLTSGSRWFALWPVLLPFTLVNAAGWMAPRTAGAGQRLATAHRAAVGLLGLITTLAATVWLCWLGQVLIAHPWTGDLTDLQARAAGFGAAALALAAIVLVATFTAEGYDRYAPAASDEAPDAPDPSGTARRQLTSRRLYDDAAERRRAWRLHVAVVVVAGAACGAAIQRAAARPDAIDALGDATWWVGVAQLVALLVLVATSAAAGLAGDRHDDADPPMACVGAAAAGLGTALVPVLTATAAALVLGTEALPAGDSLVVVPAAGLTAWAVIAAAVTVAVLQLVRPSPFERDDAADGGGPHQDVIATPSARLLARLATVPTSLGPVAAVLALALPVAIVVSALPATRPGTTWQLTQTATVSMTRWLVVGLLGFMVLSVWRARADAPSRQRVGNIWDVLTFWPRSYQPFAVRPYAERAVPELREYIERVAGDGEPVTIVAHSQGSVLALAALAPLTGPTPVPSLARVRLVTMGSPLRTLYARVFPSHIHPDLIARVADALDQHGGGWTNAFRPTDHIGRAVFRPDRDVPLPPLVAPDGAGAPTRSGDHVLPDPPRSGAALAGHSGYWGDPAFEELAAPLRDPVSPTPSPEEAP